MPNENYQFEYFPGEAQWYVRLRAIKNDKILMVSEAYTRKWSAKRAATRMAKAFGAVCVEVPE